MQSRRSFLIKSVGVVSALAVARTALAAPAKVDEKDPAAAALGYVADAGKIDKAKHPKFVAGQSCSNCQFFQGKAGDAFGACPMLGGKLVSAKGWCNVYAKKA
ncbi:high-potential iron-sulfur protein [Vogesella oryzae]|uniref:high-potential iron-sulfur protein n=1 Tax=Vogesella oryzae TaxID=1735285 RepID=UPI001583C849|nr:high-potential iron-sulfur protein [Vogesella oryzae]